MKKVKKKTRTSSKRRLVDEDPYKFMHRRHNQVTTLEREFAHAYVDNLCLIQADNNEDYAAKVAQIIGIEKYNCKRWSKGALEEPCVQRLINRLSRDRSKRTEITADRVLAEYARIAFSNIDEIVDDNFEPYPLSQIDEDAKSSISSVKKIPGKFGTIIEIKRNDKIKALEMLAKNLGLMEEQNQESPEEIALKALQAAKAMGDMMGANPDALEQIAEKRDETAED